MSSDLWTQLPAYIASFGALITAIATCLLLKATRKMADATQNMEEISKDMKKSSDKSSESTSALTLMQMVNAANSLAFASEKSLRLCHDLIKDETLDSMLREIDEDEDAALGKIWFAFIWLNLEQTHLFLERLIPKEYTTRSQNEVLGRMLQHRYVRYLISNRGYYDLFINVCIDIYKNFYGREWDFHHKS